METASRRKGLLRPENEESQSQFAGFVFCLSVCRPAWPLTHISHFRSICKSVEICLSHLPSQADIFLSDISTHSSLTVKGLKSLRSLSGTDCRCPAVYLSVSVFISRDCQNKLKASGALTHWHYIFYRVRGELIKMGGVKVSGFTTTKIHRFKQA